MFEALLWAAIAAAALALLIALDGSRDVFHPLVFLMPMMAFLYGWMPLRLLSSDGLARFFDTGQLTRVQLLNVAGILAFAGACLAAGIRVRRPRERLHTLPAAACGRLRIGGAVVGGIGLLCWLVSIFNVGGFTNAFSASYGGGWDDSGYIRDGNLLLLVAVLLLVGVIAAEGPRVVNILLALLFGLPWLSQALLTARRGLRVLADAGLVAPERAGREVRYVATAERLADAVAWLLDASRGWDRRLDRLRGS